MLPSSGKRTAAFLILLFFNFVGNPCASSFIDTLVAAPEPHNDDVGHQHHHQPRSKTANHNYQPHLAAFDSATNVTTGPENIAPSNTGSNTPSSSAGDVGAAGFTTLDEVLENHSQYPTHHDLLYLSALLEVSPKEAQNILRANWTHLQSYLVATPDGHGTSPTARRMKKPPKPSPSTTITSPYTTLPTTTATTTTQKSTPSIARGDLSIAAAAQAHTENSKHVALLHVDNTNDDVDDNDDDDGDGPVCRFSESTMLGLAAEYGNNTSRMIRFLCLNTPDHYLHLFSFEWEYVGVFLSMTAFVFALALAKIIFHVTGLVHVIPDSCILILLGFMVGAMLKVFSLNHIVTLYVFFEGRAASVFFLLLLPPIILESAYSLYDREFLKWFATVMLFAVVGTLLNAFIVGPLLYVLNLCGAMGGVKLDLTFLGCMTFSSLISAVDPVAVLALFSELGVNPALYFLVFGESLFNDAVTVVLFNTFHVLMFESEHITATHVAIALAKFFLITFGGIVIGFAFGILTTLLVKYTEHCRVVEPLLFFVLAYASYLLSELFHFSGIIGLIACGLTQWHYATRNASTKSRTTVKYFSKMLASLAESAVFVGFGILLIEEFAWHTGFICWTLFLITVVRFGVTFGLAALANRVWLPNRKISYGEQFIMSYGGLRGAIAFALSVQLNPRIMGGYNYYHRYFGFDTNYELMVTTTTVVILFTVFVQGITLKPIIGCLNVREVSPPDDEQTIKDEPHRTTAATRRQTTSNVFAELNQTILNHMYGGMNAIVSGSLDDNSTSVRFDDGDGAVESKSILQRLQRFDARHIQPWLLKTNHHQRQQQQQPNNAAALARPVTTTIENISEIIAAATAYYTAQLQQNGAASAAQQSPQQIDLNFNNNDNSVNNGKIEQLWQAAARSKALLKRQRQSVMMPVDDRLTKTPFNSSMSMVNLINNERNRQSEADGTVEQQNVRQIVPSLDNVNKEIIYNNIASTSTPSIPNASGNRSNHYYNCQTNLGFLPDSDTTVIGKKELATIISGEEEKQHGLTTPAIAEAQPRWNFPPTAASFSSVNNNDRVAGRTLSNPAREEQQLKTALSQSLDKMMHYRAARRFSVSRDGVQDSDIDDEDEDDDGQLDGNKILFTNGRLHRELSCTAGSKNTALALRRRRSNIDNQLPHHLTPIQRTLTLPIDVDIWKAKIKKSLTADGSENSSNSQFPRELKHQPCPTSAALHRSVSSSMVKSATTGRQSGSNRSRLFGAVSTAASSSRRANIVAMKKINSNSAGNSHYVDWNSRRRATQPNITIDEESVLQTPSSSTGSPMQRSVSGKLSTPGRNL